MTFSPTTDILVESQPSRDRLSELGVFDWPIWTQAASTFPWAYGDAETCYFLEGDVVVTPEGGLPVKMGKGDLVRFPACMSCTWEIHAAVKKHYTFGD